MTVAFDTHKAVKSLIHAGVGEPVAEAMVSTIGDAIGESVATKADIVRLEESMATKADLADVRTDITEVRADVRADIARLEAATKADIKRLEENMVTKADLAATNSDVAGVRVEVASVRADIRRLEENMVTKARADWFEERMAVMATKDDLRILRRDMTIIVGSIMATSLALFGVIFGFVGR